MDISEVPWTLLDLYFKDSPQALVTHHIDSYNHFFKVGIQQIFKETNPFKLELDYDNQIKDFRSVCHMYFGGKDGSKIYVGKPTIHDENAHYMFPNECRLRNMSYSMTIHYDIEIEFRRILRDEDAPTALNDKGGILFDCPSVSELTPAEYGDMRKQMSKALKDNVQTFCMTLEKMYLGRFPIMLQSDFCILKGMPREMRDRMGECRNDLGGYFIIDGKEKTVVCQEKFADNALYIRKGSLDSPFLFSAEIRSVSENVSKQIRMLKVQIMAATSAYSNQQMVVLVPNIRKPVPLFILFRALGILTDREIISLCTLDQAEYVSPSMVSYFEASIQDAATIRTQRDALEFMSLLIKGKSIDRLMYILSDYFFPHVGEVNFFEKAYHLGYMVNQLLLVAIGVEEPTDRDNYKYKRIETIGPLMKELFREYYKLQLDAIRLDFERKHDPNQAVYKDISTLIYKHYAEVFRRRMVEEGFQKAFKGDWGSTPHTKRIGVTQDLSRLSFNGMISHLRKTNLPLDVTAKIIGPRLLHNTHWGIIDPIDTPDGGNIGIHKHLAMMTVITPSLSREPIIQWIKKFSAILLLSDCVPSDIYDKVKIFVNGYWIGVIDDPIRFTKEIKLYRRHGLIPVYTSVSFDTPRKRIQIFTDEGRLCRPLFYRDDIQDQFVFETNEWKSLSKLLLSWENVVSGFHPKKKDFDLLKGELFTFEDLYKLPMADIQKNKCLLEYLDTSESENAMIAFDGTNVTAQSTHMELHESTIFGVLCNQINFPENNPVTRNSFSCGQSKQACSLYSTNYHVRMDKTAVVLNYGQVPLVKSRYLDYINHEENPYGMNAIVAVMCYTGYNVEDAVLLNEASLQRGLFNTTYYTTYEAHEEKKIQQERVIQETVFSRIEKSERDIDYSYLDDNGVILENTVVHDKMVLIGMTSTFENDKKDVPILPKKGQLGIVDKVFMTDGEEGERIVKVRIREERIPNLGDKFASRAGQKGTVGMVVAEADMPYTKDGVRPDIIINPHALPSRMTIGQLVETVVGKGSALAGVFGDCTAFHNKTTPLIPFGELLIQHGFHSTGNEVMYNGMNGEQIESEIFVGPTYYMRLKHMVKDKINFRATGPRTNLTRQPLSGRANDGGLRIGEMERDAIISHGASYFLKESMMERGDKYRMAICNQNGMIAIYNASKNLMLSPLADGPLKYSGSFVTGDVLVQQFSKFGRSFSIVEVPYSLKLLIQELQALNIRLSLITEDNIDLIEHMCFSHNIDLMLGQENATPQMLVQQINANIKNVDNRKTETEISQNTPLQLADIDGVPSEDHYEEEREPQTPPVIPQTPPYAPGSPAYLPEPVETEVSDSPKYNPFDSQEGGTRKYKVGEKVHYSGDTLSQREWTITRTGSHLLTIETHDLRGLDEMDKIKNVSIDAIYPIEDYIYINEVDLNSMEDVTNALQADSMQNLNSQNMQLPLNTQNTQNTQNMQRLPQMHSHPNIQNPNQFGQMPHMLPVDMNYDKINFHPVINVITDGKESHATGDVVAPDDLFQTPMLRTHMEPEKADNTKKLNSTIDFTQPIIIQKNP